MTPRENSVDLLDPRDTTPREDSRTKQPSMAPSDSLKVIADPAEGVSIKMLRWVFARDAYWPPALPRAWCTIKGQHHEYVKHTATLYPPHTSTNLDSPLAYCTCWHHHHSDAERRMAARFLFGVFITIFINYIDR